MEAKIKNSKLIFVALVLFSGYLYAVSPISDYSALIALILGILLSSLNIFYKPKKLNKYRKLILNSSIIFFGFSLNIREVIDIGSKGIIISFISLSIIIACGYILMRVYKVDKKTAELTTYGTAICGGSAISATASVLNPDDKQLALSTATIFILNGVALLIFPFIGHILFMSQEQFGVFCALSIHDVSSVVGAASIYGEQSLKLATVLKLTRTLWIIPITLILSYIYKTKDSKFPVPLFILGFILASIFSSVVNVKAVTDLSVIGKYLLPMALFMVGYAIKLEDIRSLGKSAIYFGLSLWGISILVGLTLSYIW